MSDRYVIGLDFGTASARSVVLDAGSGEELAVAVAPYRHGVLDATLPDGTGLPPQFALQHPGDWLEALRASLVEAVAASGVAAERVVGVGVDFTSCTILPVDDRGTPLALVPGWGAQPHAWPKLWKHHAAQPHADAANALASGRGETWIKRYGGGLSAEWLLPKIVEIAERAPEVLAAADRIVEAADWIVWQLTGTCVRNACGAGFKASWHKRDGYPSDGYLAALAPALDGYFGRQGRGVVAAPGTAAGVLSAGWAERLGLPPTTAVATGIIDAHAGMLGAGITAPGELYLAMGTSTCDLLLTEDEVLVPGVAGIVEDGIVPGLFAHEAGQAAVGDLFEWQVRQTGRSHAELTAEAARSAPGASGLLALDWWNGCRTPLMDSDLGGVLLGCSLATTPGEIYRAMLEATAFGTRMIVAAFTGAGVDVRAVCAGGGLTANALLTQIYADVLGRPLELCRSAHPSARGAAVLAAVAAGVHADVAAAGEAMAPARDVIHPDASATVVYDRLYRLYAELVDVLGRERGSALHRLTDLRREALAGHPPRPQEIPA